MNTKNNKFIFQNYPDLYSCTVAVIGLGYVGLPIAIEIAKNRNCYRTNKNIIRNVIGFDINQTRLRELKKGYDRTNETNSEELGDISNILFTDDFNDLIHSDVFIITVPTPVDNSKNPDFSALEKASELIGNVFKIRNNTNADKLKKSIPIVIFESTVYPGATEDICIPIIENSSGLKLNNCDSSKTFICGYSPERINPGDLEHRLTSIVKVTSGSNLEALDWIDQFYGSFIKAGTHKASSIKVAEAAKVIENIQRDLNIALVNELSIIFNKLGIDTLDVLNAASTKWNFLSFKPGLVGGHCISVDPYYLTYKSQQIGYYPDFILAGRRINDQMSTWIAEQVVVQMARKGLVISGSNVLILGLTFKENCPDMRNSRVIDLISKLNTYGIDPTIVDPFVDKQEALNNYNLKVSNILSFERKFNAVILLVSHDYFKKIDLVQWQNLTYGDGIYFDLKGIIPRSINPIRV